MALEVLEKEKWKMKAAWRSGFVKGQEVGKGLRAFLRRSERHTKQRTREKRAHGRAGKRRGSLDPRVGLGLAAVFITAFISIMVVAMIQPTVDQSIPANNTLRPAYDTFTSYVGKSFSMWGLAIFVSVLGLVVGAIYAFWRG
ncbi:hypothetical protein [Thermococcus sp. 21S7]|uniref:hypothetical protein n=1 Tax=Thermococcus sp. 21S7 TaxID=1638221 RepID=UPI00197F95CE|nr:hypothetical protein [Thermococcus sp. 21S7]